MLKLKTKNEWMKQFEKIYLSSRSFIYNKWSMESLWEGEGITFQTLVDFLTESLRWDSPWSSV